MNALALSCAPITPAKRVRERARARSASFPPIVRAYRLRECWRVERVDSQKTIFRKTQSSRAEKGKRKCASWIRARPSLHTYLRRAATPTSRRWKGVHAALEFGVLRVEKWMGMRGAHARSAKRAYSAGFEAFSRSKILFKTSYQLFCPYASAKAGSPAKLCHAHTLHKRRVLVLREAIPNSIPPLPP